MFEKIFTEKIPGYIHFGNIHILFNLNASNTKIFSDMDNTGSENVHLFINDYGMIEHGILKEFISNIPPLYKFTIHVPKQVKDLKILIERLLPENSYCKVIVERKGPTFKIPGKSGYMLNIVDDSYGVTASIPIISMNHLNYKLRGDIFNSIPKTEYPILYKKEMIKQFKKITPVGILKNFNNDEDIWDYIMMQGEWNIHPDGGKNDKVD